MGSLDSLANSMWGQNHWGGALADQAITTARISTVAQAQEESIWRQRVAMEMVAQTYSHDYQRRTKLLLLEEP
jgi:hypothetical protein